MLVAEGEAEHAEAEKMRKELSAAIFGLMANLALALCGQAQQAGMSVRVRWDALPPLDANNVEMLLERKGVLTLCWACFRL